MVLWSGGGEARSKRVRLGLERAPQREVMGEKRER